MCFILEICFDLWPFFIFIFLSFFNFYYLISVILFILIFYLVFLFWNCIIALLHLYVNLFLFFFIWYFLFIILLKKNFYSNDRGSTCKFRNARSAFESYTWILCLSYLHEKQTSRIQSLYLYFIKIVPFGLRNIRFLIQNTRSLFYGGH